MCENDNSKVVLITGAAQRIGKAITLTLHQANWRVMIHYHSSSVAASELCGALNLQRFDSAYSIQGDLADTQIYRELITQTVKKWGRLDALINNASIFIPSIIGEISVEHWQTILAINTQAPFFLTQAAFPYLQKTAGCVVNITDTHADGRPIKNYPIYNISKTALLMQTQTLARELAPLVRVNAVAPGISIWDHTNLTTLEQDILQRTPLKRSTEAQEVANAVKYLVTEGSASTGSVIYVDGGRCVFN